MKVVAGIDVGKRELMVCVAGGAVQCFGNQESGISALLSWLRAEGPVTHAVCEATGGYERQVVNRLRASEIAVQAAHPNRVRSFAQAVGQGAKTDPLDAQVLARYGELLSWPEQTPPDAASLELREALSRRQQLVAQRVQEVNRLEKGLRGGAQEVV